LRRITRFLGSLTLQILALLARSATPKMKCILQGFFFVTALAAHTASPTPVLRPLPVMLLGIWHAYLILCLGCLVEIGFVLTAPRRLRPSLDRYLLWRPWSHFWKTLIQSFSLTPLPPMPPMSPNVGEYGGLQ